MEATAILLAAGLGTRMKSALPKALHPIAGRPMLHHLLLSCQEVFDHAVVVAGPGMDALAAAAAPHPTVIQHDRLGTAHAALQAAAHFGHGRRCGAVCRQPAHPPGDAAPAAGGTGRRPTGPARHAAGRPGRYGRVITTGRASSAIVEWADATEQERGGPACATPA